LPRFDNDLQNGGKAYKVHLTRCGGLAVASKDSFKRVYGKDSMYHYPKITENLLLEKGKDCF